jgi:two-component system response regulator YesN
MVTLIEERAAERLSIRLLARTLGRQEAYLGRLFRQQTGVTVHEYVTRIRMSRAASLIRQGANVEGVALEVGYRS